MSGSTARGSTPPASRCAPATSSPIALDRSVRVLKVKGFADRRGAADAGPRRFMTIFRRRQRRRRLRRPGMREAGAGRPTKRERRAIDRLMEADLGRDDEP